MLEVEAEGINPTVYRIVRLVDGIVVGGRVPQRRLDRCWLVLEAYRGKGSDLILDQTSWKGLFMRVCGELFTKDGFLDVGGWQAVPYCPSAVTYCSPGGRLKSLGSSRRSIRCSLLCVGRTEVHLSAVLSAILVSVQMVMSVKAEDSKSRKPNIWA